nr:MAG TPA: hypothetical protein [Caudoviricetes sp.]
MHIALTNEHTGKHKLMIPLQNTTLAGIAERRRRNDSKTKEIRRILR